MGDNKRSPESSDDESSEAPSPSYLRMRRRSNTLPKDFLSNLRSKASIQETSNDSFDAEDNVDNFEPELPPKLLNKKLNKVIEERNKQTSPLGVHNKHLSSKPHHLPPITKVDKSDSQKSSNENLNHKTVTRKSASPVHIKHTDNRMRKISLPTRPNPSPPKSAEHAYRKLSVPARPSSTQHFSSAQTLTSSTGSLIDSLMDKATKDELECTKKHRDPLPRGSNLYESVLQEFGREEEERDFLSPLPSPNIKRKISHGIHKGSHAHNHLFTQSVPSTPPNMRRVHWSQDTHFNKYK